MEKKSTSFTIDETSVKAKFKEDWYWFYNSGYRLRSSEVFALQDIEEYQQHLEIRVFESKKEVVCIQLSRVST